MTTRRTDDHAVIYLIGGGIASLAAAAFLIRDGDIPGQNITILEESDRIGGSLDAAGNAEDGYIMRGGRMFESKYLCTYDLFSSIPTLDTGKSVTQEIVDWNETLVTSSKSRLFRDGQRVDAPQFGLSEKHILTIERLALEPEGMLGRSAIYDQFDHSFFETDFWRMWCTTFAFQPWHSAVEFKRYLLRFTHMVSGFNTLTGIMRTVYNQYDSLVRPLHKWLSERAVQFELNTRVTDLVFRQETDGLVTEKILVERNGQADAILVSPGQKVMVTLGSMTDSATLGSMNKPPVLDTSISGGAWSLWGKIAAGRPNFGNPANFTSHIDESKWLSFTTTLHDPEFFTLVGKATGNVPGEGGLITFPTSSWLTSIVLPHQPHFLGQPQGVDVFWGYGLRMDRPGDFVKKSMPDCSGREIMTEILGQLHITSQTKRILDTCICIPCMMPFITSQFLCRDKGDRPLVIPEGTRNLAFIGQFCEIPEDVVFTVEYSIRSAQLAVYSLLGLNRVPVPVFQGSHSPRVLLQAYRALHEVSA